jgi:hypothetical protein
VRIRRFDADAFVLDEHTVFLPAAGLPLCKVPANGPPEGSALGVTDAQRQDPGKLMADAYDRMLRAAGYSHGPWQARMLYARPVVNDPEGGRYVAHGE